MSFQRPSYVKPQFVPAIKSLDRLKHIAMNIGLIGSRWSEEDSCYFSEDRWGLLAPHFKIFGFDPDPEACKATAEAIQARGVTWPVELIPAAVWNSVGQKTLNVTRDPSASSLLKPSDTFRKRVVNTDYLAVEKTIEVPTVSLDSIFTGSDQILDYLQIDVQGGELAVLEGAEKLLARGTLAILTEVTFSPIYDDRASYADVFQFLNDRGYAFCGFLNATTDGRRGIPLKNDWLYGIPTWGNALFFYDLIGRDPYFRKFTPEQYLKAACLSDLIGVYDQALELLAHLTLHQLPTSPFNYADFIYRYFTEALHRPPDEVNRLSLIQRLRPYFRERSIPALPVFETEPSYLLRLRDP